MATISSNYGEFYAYNIKAFCPICKNNFTGWYCPSCGLPKEISKYAPSKYGTPHNCGQYHFRPEFSSFENIQLCDKCYTTNPSNAKYIGVFSPNCPISVVVIRKLSPAACPNAVSGTLIQPLFFSPSTAK